MITKNKAANIKAQEIIDKHTAETTEINTKIENIQADIDKKVLEQANARDKVVKHQEQAAEYERQSASIEGIKGLIKNLEEQKQANRNASEELDAELSKMPVKSTTELQAEVDRIAQEKQKFE